MKTLQRKIIKVILCLTLVLPGMFSPFTCPGFSFPIFNLLTTVKAEEDPGTTTATNTGIAALIAILMASGIRFVGDYETVIQPAVTQLWDDFSSYAGNQLTLAQLGAGIAIGQGYLRVESSVNNAVNSFQNWYTTTFSVPNNGTVNIELGSKNYYSLSNTPIALVTGSENFYIKGDDSIRACFTNAGSVIWAYLMSTAPATSYYAYSANGTYYARNLSSSEVFDGVTYYSVGFAVGTSGSQIMVNTVANGTLTTRQAYEYLYGQYSSSIGDVTMEGQTYDLKDGYNLDQDQAKLIDIAGLAALASALGLALENVTDLVNDIPLIYGYPWAQDFPDVYPNTPADTIPWVDTPTSVIPQDVPEYVPTTPSETDSYKVLGLERVFPFSIPFDLIALVRVLNAEPVTPSFTFKLYDPYKHRNVSQTVTLEQFSSIAAVFRVGVVLLFLAALIKLTRILIRG